MKRFDLYKEAFNHAAMTATATRLTLVIRKTKEFGKWGYSVNFKSNDGSDYLGETVNPDQPLIG